MGMSASQVRYLSLQKRQSTIGTTLMTLSNRRTALERDMSRVAREYNEAMNKKTIKWSSNAGISYTDLTYDLLMRESSGAGALPYLITDSNGRLVVDDTEINNSGLSLKDIAFIISNIDASKANDYAKFTADKNDLLKRIGGEAGNKNSGVYDAKSLSYSDGSLNSLRIWLFSELGLISNETKNPLDEKPENTSITIIDDGSTINENISFNNVRDYLIANQNNIRNNTQIIVNTSYYNQTFTINTDYTPDYVIGEIDKNVAQHLNTSVNNTKITSAMRYYDAIFQYIAENGWVYDSTINDPTHKTESKNDLQEKLRNNIYNIVDVKTGIQDQSQITYDTKLAANIDSFYEVYDTNAQNVALAEYEAEKTDIQAKEKQIDLRMSKLETEQNAIKTELDSIKSIINDNVNTTFKIFA